ncbi:MULTISPECIES: mercuric transport protein MerTP [Pedobacter]|uniref:Mercuric transport protein MerT n=1 Tax=Pedobacter roseus TaxID=336820 RepID=A0A7G9QH59_9SPHI|nr:MULTISPECIES: mercuric transport protein MerTP [Pedobacter]QNN42684.1 mercuric transport protein MerTP [Pedobacter roseus]
MNKEIQKSWIAGLLSACTASLCCIVPFIAAVGGSAGSASIYFNWIEPYRPYMIVLTFILFGLSWYKILTKKPMPSDNCGCENERKNFMGSKKFLGIVTVVCGLLIAFPYYSNLFAGQGMKSSITTQEKLQTARLSINGMSCAGCTDHIDKGLSGIRGIARSTTSFEKAMTTVIYNPDSISADSISKKIKQIGYRNSLIEKN